jgi:hypothetical protein
MNKKTFLTLFTLAVLIAVGVYIYKDTSRESVSIPVSVVATSSSPSYVKENDLVSVNITYPTLDEKMSGAKEANQAIKKDLDTRIAAFEKESADNLSDPIDLPKDIISTADGSLSIVENNARYVSMIFVSEWYMRGAAHPYHVTYTFIFDKKLGKLVTIQDLFMPYSKYFQFLSSYAYNDLIKQSEEGDTGFTYDKDMLKSGTEATLENFRLAVPTKDGLVIHFDEYQVAPYAAGAQQVTVPYAKLQEFINPEGALSIYLK